ncbi:alpha/beta hydrolase [Amphiplicatus metriothermophilus]|uniref:Alpha/beta hydrolase fold n=1 Tax=Amphiplicatus metriothermophilus TaxID=1519374 RepID=A0A239PVC5_9PROT|nr:alpha/beta hydrolase [Amphiplicatus metriothermophilus]MBB5519642.1 acetyl esterase/lipase [Amphiplicatus metriothermophilus]SNT74205.1 alpha/beta hydrolase fold [Amphiplicatus metriothermophilus]
MTRFDRRTVLAGGLALSAGGAGTAQARGAGGAGPLLVDLDREPDLEIALWPKGPPGGAGVALSEHYVSRENPWGLPDRAAHEVTRPTLTLFRAARPDGSALLIIPGGGYSWVVVEKEGFEGARYFSRLGATVYVLKYRLPHQGWAAGPDTPLQDAQRAMRVIRARSAEDGVNPARVGVMGFSAGGHLAGSLATRFAARVYDPVDDADRLSARPDLSALVYPAATMKPSYAHAGSRENLIGARPAAALVEKYSIESAPPPDAPPTWILHASDDAAVPVENALLVYRSFKDAGIPVSLHVFERGGHGFGLRVEDGDPLQAWPSLYWRWAASRAARGGR